MRCARGDYHASLIGYGDGGLEQLGHAPDDVGGKVLIMVSHGSASSPRQSNAATAALEHRAVLAH
jgi:hypothetical protein